MEHWLATEAREGKLLCTLQRGKDLHVSESLILSLDAVWARLQSSVLDGFQAATAAGPLMQELLHGVCFVIESLAVSSAVTGLSNEDTRLLFQTAHPGGYHDIIGVDGAVLSVNGKGTMSGQLLS